MSTRCVWLIPAQPLKGFEPKLKLIFPIILGPQTTYAFKATGSKFKVTETAMIRFAIDCYPVLNQYFRADVRRTWSRTGRGSVEAVRAQLGSGRRSVPCGRHRRRCRPAACRRATPPHLPCETCAPRPGIDDMSSPVTESSTVSTWTT